MSKNATHIEYDEELKTIELKDDLNGYVLIMRFVCVAQSLSLGLQAYSSYQKSEWIFLCIYAVVGFFNLWGVYYFFFTLDRSTTVHKENIKSYQLKKYWGKVWLSIQLKNGKTRPLYTSKWTAYNRQITAFFDELKIPQKA
jgi:hypothetical protein